MLIFYLSSTYFSTYFLLTFLLIYLSQRKIDKDLFALCAVQKVSSAQLELRTTEK